MTTRNGTSGRRRTWIRNNLELLFRLSFCASLLCYSLLVVCHYQWESHIQLLLRRYRWNETQNALSRTYYHRHCTHQDISTTEPDDLIIQPAWNTNKAVDNVLRHGVSIFPGLVDKNVADAFRNYTLVRNSRLEKADMVYVMNAFKKQQQTRWSFAFTPHEHPSVNRFLQQVGSNEKMRRTLEDFLGSDPAIIKMQTITSRYGAESQGWHPDVNAKASALSHARDFMMHFSLFIPLQDTPPRMGATGVCPGTQYCGTVDPEELDLGCHQVSSGVDDRGHPVWWTGDAVLMNQNTWHRGWAHTLQNGEDRAMVVITFTSRPPQNKGVQPKYPMYTPLRRKERVIVSSTREDTDSRILSLGTPLSSFGYTMRDLTVSSVGASTVLDALRYLGLYKPANSNWGWDYTSSVLSRIASETHKFKKQDLSDWLLRTKRGSLWSRMLLKYVLSDNLPPSNKERGVWDLWLTDSFAKSMAFFRTFVLGSSLLLVTALLSSPKHARSVLAKKIFVSCSILAVLLGGIHWQIRSSALIRGIRSGASLRSSFPHHGDRLAINSVEPSRDDVLIGTRFNSLYLGAFNRFLDSHPGNKLWLEEIRDVADARILDWGAGCLLFDALSSKITKRAKGKFLLQHSELGTFIELTPEAARRETKKQLLMEFSPHLHHLEQTLAYIISHLRFESSLRETTLAAVSVKVLGQLRESLFENTKIEQKHELHALLERAGQSLKSTKFRPGFQQQVAINQNVMKMQPSFQHRNALVEDASSKTRSPSSSGYSPSTSSNIKRKVDGKRIIRLNNNNKLKRKRKKI